MVLGQPIYDSKRRILLTAGRTIDPKIKDRLLDLGISYIFVEDEVSKGIELDDMLDMPTWTEAIKDVQEYHELVRDNKKADIRKIQEVAKKLTNEVKGRVMLVLIPSGAIAKELHLYAHSVNVAILSLLTAKKLGYSDIRLKDLAVGALLHDVGKMLTRDYDKHSESGFNHLRFVSQMSIVSAHIAYQHHEKVDGTGSPRKIAGKDFIEVAQICGVANLYENLITKEGMPPHEAMEGIMAASDIYFDHHIVQSFTHAVPTYPPGTRVIVDNQYPSIVTKVDKHFQRPVVKILADDRVVDLAEVPTVMIKPDLTAS